MCIYSVFSCSWESECDNLVLGKSVTESRFLRTGFPEEWRGVLEMYGQMSGDVFDRN